MGVLGGVFVLKSGLRILIRAPQVPFSVPPKTPKMGVFGYFGGTKNNRGAKYKEPIHMPKAIHSKELQIYAKNYVCKHSEVNHGQLWKAQKWIHFLFSFEFDKYHLRRVRKDISWYG